MNPTAVHTLLQFPPDPVVYWIDVSTVGWPEIGVMKSGVSLVKTIVCVMPIDSRCAEGSPSVTELQFFCHERPLNISVIYVNGTFCISLTIALFTDINVKKLLRFIT